jgi:hypothetical protein
MRRILQVLAIAVLLGGCVSQRPASAALNEYLPYAGPPIDNFHFWQMYSWEAVGPYQVVLWATPWDAYFVTVQQPCFDLQWVQRIGVTSTAGTVSRFESLLLPHHERCPITEIRAIDTKQLKAARVAREAARKNGGVAPPPAAAPAQPPAPPPASPPPNTSTASGTPT